MEPVKPNFKSKEAYQESKKKQAEQASSPLGKLNSITKKYLDANGYEGRSKGPKKP